MNTDYQDFDLGRLNQDIRLTQVRSAPVTNKKKSEVGTVFSVVDAGLDSTRILTPRSRGRRRTGGRWSSKVEPVVVVASGDGVARYWVFLLPNQSLFAGFGVGEKERVKICHSLSLLLEELDLKAAALHSLKTQSLRLAALH
ncbi:hypothetical protein RHGRI_007452 [Rhododendron griersonianum]|uniref:Uncharacterized protein n=1 Tax=Rhododendron griersonianum TaxID=479676 RepID=A0AAV6KWW0_9ERIC|nr:hypothetical protein RHGRI_007452 [Rhododendron griersonianum]